LYLDEQNSSADQTYNLLTYSGGNFYHNDGKVDFNPRRSVYNSSYTVVFSQTISFYDVQIGYYTSWAGSGFQITGNANVEGDLYIEEIWNGGGGNQARMWGGNWFVYGDLRLGTSVRGGDTQIHLVGDQDTQYITSGGDAPEVIINKDPGATVSPDVGLTNFEANTITISSGTFIAPPGTLTLGVQSNVYSNENVTFFNITGGDFIHNDGRVRIASSGVYVGSGYANFSITPTFNDFSLYYHCQWSYDELFQINGSAIVEGDLNIERVSTQYYEGTITSPLNGGNLYVEGNVTIGTLIDGGSTQIHFTGSGDQTYTDLGGDEPDGDIYINKEDGFVLLNSHAQWNASGQALYLQKGKFIVGSNYSVYLNGLSISQGGEFNMIGTGDLILYSNAINNGKFIARARGVCGGSDSIFIRSNSTGVQRAWSGNGSFVIQDTEVRDMSGTAPITVYSSTNSGNNGSNWTFSSDPCPEAPVSAEIRGGLISIPNGLVEIQ